MSSLHKLDHLVVVHPNMLDLRHERNRSLVENIRDRTQEVMAADHEAFVLPVRGFADVRSDGVFSQLQPFPRVIPQEPVVDIPEEMSLTDLQFIRLKLALTSLSIDSVHLAGVARSRCVAELEKLLRGEQIKPAVLAWIKSLMMGISLFEEVVRRKIKTHILDELCID